MALIRDYMNEHYSAARNHQRMRLQAMALYVSASSILFVQGVIHYKDGWPRYVVGVVLLILAALCLYQNYFFNRANRLHVKIARRARQEIVRGEMRGGEASPVWKDPSLIRKIIQPLRKKDLSDADFDKAVRDFKDTGHLPEIEASLYWSLASIPLLIALAGAALLGLLSLPCDVICVFCRP
jgi:hypothetical protein